MAERVRSFILVVDDCAQQNVIYFLESSAFMDVNVDQAKAIVSLAGRLRQELACSADYNGLPSKFASAPFLTIRSQIYGALVFHASDSLKLARTVHQAVYEQALAVIARDRYTEQGDTLYLAEAERWETRVAEAVGHDDFMSLRSRLYVYWEREAAIADKLWSKETVSEKELQALVKRKSSDAFLYGHIAERMSGMSKAATLALYVRQLRRDFVDDFEDLEEDLESKQPNPLIVRLAQKAFTPEENNLEHQVIAHGAIAEQAAFVARYCSLLERLVPSQYRWLIAYEPRRNTKTEAFLPHPEF